jgi:uncharacterized protein (DUF885 family)
MLALRAAPRLEWAMAAPHLAGRSGSGRVISILFATAIFASSAVLVGSQTTESAGGWIQRSDAFAARLIQLEQRLRPETAASNPELDDQVSDLSTDSPIRAMAAFRRLRDELVRQHAHEEDPDVREDLGVLVERVKKRIRGIELDSTYELPYVDPASQVFSGINALLTERLPDERRRKALDRLRKYAGLELGTTPLATVATQRIRRALNKRGLSMPPRSQVDRDLTQSPVVLAEVRSRLQRFGIPDYEPVVAELDRQIARYHDFIREAVLPKCPPARRIPQELYQFRLRQAYGVELSPTELARRARAAFRDTRGEMQALADGISAGQRLAPTDYRTIIHSLRQRQLDASSIVQEYTARLRDIEQIIQHERLMTLPPGQPTVRVATAVENNLYGAPVTICPQSRTKPEDTAQCETVMPLALPVGNNGEATPVEDYTLAAASWTLTAHEIRPGHELQFDAMIANGTSMTRRSVGVTLANPEGWAVYAEHLLRPFMPAEARLISLQFLLLREARAFLDIELQTGVITSEEAFRVLGDDVALSEPMARAELARLVGSPGSGPSYFFGYSEFLGLRRDVEQALGARFDQRAYHDFVLAQGKLPMSAIREAVMSRFLRGEPVSKRRRPARSEGRPER